MDIGKNIIHYRELAGLSQKELADKIGVSNQRLNNWEKNVNKPNADYIASLCNILNVKADELLDMNQVKEITINEAKLLRTYNELTKPSQDLVMHTAEELLKIEKEQTTTIIPYVIDRKTTTEIDYYPQAAGMGRDQYVKDAVPDKLSVSKNKLPKHADFLVKVVGDSMEPTYQSGDKLFIQKTDYLDPGDIGVFNFDGEQMVKEVGNGELISHNKKYEPIKTAGHHLTIQGKVIGILEE